MRLSTKQIDEFRSRGYLLVKRALGPDTVAMLQSESNRLWNTPALFDKNNLRTRVRASGDRPLDRLDPVIDLSTMLSDLASSQALAEPSGDLLGGPAVLMKDKLIFKPPRAAGYSNHQDFAYWQWLQIPPEAALTVMAAIDPADAVNGATAFFPGRHDRLLTPQGRVCDLVEAGIDMEGEELVETQPGDLLFFHSLIPHGSGPNNSNRMRRQLFLSYNNGAYGRLYAKVYQGLHEFLKAEMADSGGCAYYL